MMYLAVSLFVIAAITESYTIGAISLAVAILDIYLEWRSEQK